MKDPRVVGGRYYNGYWRYEYTVIARQGVTIIERMDTPMNSNLGNASQVGQEIKHCTPWDATRDRIISTPIEIEQQKQKSANFNLLTPKEQKVVERILEAAKSYGRQQLPMEAKIITILLQELHGITPNTDAPAPQIQRFDSSLLTGMTPVKGV